MTDAALRHELAGELGSLIWERQEIVGLVQAHAPAIAVADLPQGSARTLWTHVLVELANRSDAGALKALLAEAGKRSKRIAWARYEVLAAAPAPGGAWSHLTLDLRWETERGDRRAAAHVAREQVIVEAEATLQWSGTRPADPALAFELGPLLGPRRRETQGWQPTGSGVAGIATWSAVLPVKPTAFSTRRIAAVADDRRAVRYLVARSGYYATLALWLLLALFIGLWLAPLGAAVVAIGLGTWLALFGVGWLVPRLRELAGPMAWITRAWETTAPLVGVLAGLTVLLPPLLLVMVTNRSAEEVRIDGDVVEPTGRRILLGHPDLSAKRTTQCVCPIEPGCRCDEEPVRFVTRFEVQCRSVLDEKCSELMRVTLAAMLDPPAPAGTVKGEVTVPLDWPKGFEQVQFARGAFASSMTLTSGGAAFAFADVRISDRAPEVLALKVLAEPAFKIEFADRSALSCVLPGRRANGMVGVIDVSQRMDFTIELGAVQSHWHAGGPEPVRAWLTPAEVATITLGRAPEPGLRIRLPDNLGIKQVRIGRDRDALECREPGRLRFVGSRTPGIKLPFAHGRIDDNLVATCVAPGFKFRVGAATPIECELEEAQVACRRTRVPGPLVPPIDSPTHVVLPPYQGPCTLHERTNELKATASPRCRKLEETEAMWKRAITIGQHMAPRKLLCNQVFLCP